MNDLEQDELLSLEPIAIDSEHVKALTFSKLNPRSQTQKAKHLVRPRFKMLVAACIVIGALFVGTAAYAVGSILIVGENPFDFFFHFDSAEIVNEPEGGVPIYGDTLPNLEDYNIAIGQTIQSDGVAVTLDTVAIDDNFIVVFLTYQFDEPVDTAAIAGEGYIDLDALRMFAGQPVVALDGLVLNSEEGGAGFESKDSAAYFADESQRIVKTATQYLIPILLPNELTLSVTVEPTATDERHVLISAVPEPLTFTVGLDKTAAAALTHAIEPGTYDFNIEGKTWTLDLQKFAITPFGAVIVVNTHEGEQGNAHYLGLWDFDLMDQSGAVLQRFAPGSAQNGAIHAAFIRSLPAGLTSICIAPPTTAPRPFLSSYALSDIGARMPTNANNGLILREVRVEGNLLTIISEPYGDMVPISLGAALENSGAGAQGIWYKPEFIVDTDGLDPYLYDGLVEYGLDDSTGLYVFTYSFYTASEDQIRQLSHYYLPYDPGEITYDTAQAVTLPVR